LKNTLNLKDLKHFSFRFNKEWITPINYPNPTLKHSSNFKQLQPSIKHQDLDSSKLLITLDSTVKTVYKLSKDKSNFENVLASQNCVFGKARLGFNPQNKQDKFSKSFSKLPEKQLIVLSKQLVVTCFYYMKRGHSVRFCKIRKYFVPKGIMRWIPKDYGVPSDECKSKAPTFKRGPNLCT